MAKSTLSDKDKERIYQLYTEDQKPQKKIADFYDVSQSTISQVIKTKSFEKEIEQRDKFIQSAAIEGIKSAVSKKPQTHSVIDVDPKQIEDKNSINRE